MQNRHHLSTILIFVIAMIFSTNIFSKSINNLPGFQRSAYLNEQILKFSMNPNINVEINAPDPESFNPNKRVLLVFYATPNFNTIEQTIGKKMLPGVDWHFNIQNIGAQTRFLRNLIHNETIIVAYVSTKLQSWPWWKTRHSNPDSIIATVVDSVKHIFKNFHTDVVLSGHSGGGSFVLGYINEVKSIPNSVKRICFLDSDYDYDNILHGGKIISWLKSGNDHFLSVLAFDDRNVKWDGKNTAPINSGTFYHSTLMEEKLSSAFRITTITDSLFIKYIGLDGRIEFNLKLNPNNQMWHTVQVEDNGFIQTMLSGTKNEGEGYTYWGPRAYNQFIQPY